MTWFVIKTTAQYTITRVSTFNILSQSGLMQSLQMGVALFSILPAPQNPESDPVTNIHSYSHYACWHQRVGLARVKVKLILQFLRV
jgi:hypothetical protein